VSVTRFLGSFALMMSFLLLAGRKPGGGNAVYPQRIGCPGALHCTCHDPGGTHGMAPMECTPRRYG